MKTLSTQSLLTWILAIMLTCGAASVEAATFTVTKATDSNDGVCDTDCSLREAVAAADSGDVVVFSGSLIGSTVTLGGTQIDVTKRITIDGALDSVNVAFVSGGNMSRHFSIQSGGGLDLRNMILVQGNESFGGSIEAVGDTSLSLDRVAIRGNTSFFGGALHLSGLANHRITNSSITGNTADQIPAIVIGESTNVFMSNTTVSGNRSIGNNANDRGTITNFGDLVLRNCTITANEARAGGGIYSGGGDPGELDIGNSIIAGNTASVIGPDINVTGNQLISVGGNLIGDSDTIPGGVFNKPNDVMNVNPKLAPTNSQQGGHPVITHPLNAGSPAINTGLAANAVEPLSNVPLVTDARGGGFPRIAGGGVDKGAFEDQSNGSTLVVSKLANSNDNVCDIDCSLREAVFAASQDPGTDNITMAANVFGTMPVGNEIVIEDQSVNIIGYPSSNSNTLIVSGGNTSRVFRLGNATVTMTGFTIANGTGNGQGEPFGGGGLVAFGGNLTLNQMIIRNNTTAESGAGGGLTTTLSDVVRIMNSTINNNSATGVMGASIGATVTYITNTTVSTNTNSDGFPVLGALSVSGTLYMRNSTIANNRASGTSSGGGLRCGPASTCNLGNNILADNIAQTNQDLSVDAGGTLVSVGGNLVETITGYNNEILSQPGDQIGVDAGLMPLQNYGGNIPTIALGGGSMAINSGVNAVAVDPFSSAPLMTDARGAGFARILGGTVDKGAFEAAGTSAATVSIGGRVTANGRPLSRAKVILTDQHGSNRMVMTSSFGYYKFDDVEIGQTYIVRVASKVYQFTPRIIVVTDGLTDLDFTPDE